VSETVSGTVSGTVSDSAGDGLWTPLVEQGSRWCAPNVHADARWLDADGVRWRVAVTHVTPRNSYVVSATGQYLDYAMEETRRIPSTIGRSAGRTMLATLSPLLRALDPVVILDALPVSTVLHAHRSLDNWSRAFEAARREWPNLPILVRSLDAVTSASTLDAMRSLRLSLVPSRLVFHQDPRAEAFWHIRNVRHDVSLHQREPLECRALRDVDAAHVQRLYWMLYGGKHSRLNPEFTASWLAHGMATGLLEGEGVLLHGRLVAAYLSYAVNGVMTNPVFGYDTSLPQSLGLYRRLGVLALQAARRKGHILHASSGAPAFKATRGGVPAIEYHAVQLRGVRGTQRVAWESMIRIAQVVGPTLLRRAT
jgi:hypothetical protein